MITSMTQQEIFDTVVRHLAMMPKRSIHPIITDGRHNPACAYRGVGGLKCAVGVLLEDNECYMEDGTHFDVIPMSVLAIGEDLPLRLKPHVELLRPLQIIHDQPLNWDEDGPNDRMPRALKKTAKAWGLNPAVIDEAFSAPPIQMPVPTAPETVKEECLV